MRKYRSGVAMALMVLAGCSAFSGGSSDPVPTAPVPTTAAPFTAAPAKSTPDSVTTPATTASPTVAPPTTSSSTTTTGPPTTAPAPTMPTGPVAVGGEPFLVDIPGKMIDYVPDVAANLNIDVPGQYYEILPKFYVFIPTQASTTNPDLQTPDPADRPILEAYVRAMAETWKVYTIDPIPAEGSAAMQEAFTAQGYATFDPILKDAADAQIHTEIRSGNLLVPHVDAGARSETSAHLLDCGWLDQVDLNQSGGVYEEWNQISPLTATVVAIDGAWKVDGVRKDSQGCS